MEPNQINPKQQKKTRPFGAIVGETFRKFRGNTMKKTERYLNLINNSLFRTTGKLDYERVTQAIINMSRYIYDNVPDDENEGLWYLGESSDCCLSDLIVGAFWHYTEWHSGQNSKGYEALSALGGLFSPNMSSLDKESGEFQAYEMLEQLAKA